MVIAKPKQESKIIEFGERRLNAMISIDPKLDFGDGINLHEFSELIEESQNQLETYNETIATLEQLIIEMAENDKAIVELAKRLLDAIAAKRGRNSSDYKLVNSIKLNPAPPKSAKPKTETAANQPTAANQSAPARNGTVSNTVSGNGAAPKQELVAATL